MNLLIEHAAQARRVQTKAAFLRPIVGVEVESRYNLTARQDPNVKMSRGKPVPVGPTAKLGDGVTWDRLAAMKPEDIRSRNLFPYLALPHPKHATGGQVFPQMQLSMFPRLERFDVDFDLPEAFLPAPSCGH
jgi:hypothetical protein